MAHVARTDGSVQTGQAALPHKNNQLKADYIEVAGIEHRGNVLARTYTAKIKIEEYIISNFAGINNKISKKSLVAQFIKNEEDEEVINELEQELKHRKEILAKKRDNQI